MTCRIEPIDVAGEAEWDAYVNGSANATLFHQAAWRHIVEGVYGHTGIYLAARKSDRLCGILPIFRCGNRFVGRTMVALPFAATQPSVCADDDQSEILLIEAAETIARQHGAEAIELREARKKPWNWQPVQSYMNVQLALDPDPDIVWRKRVESRVRTKVKGAQRGGLQFRWAGIEDLDVFFDIYTHTMHRLGSPPHCRRLFEQVLLSYPSHSAIAVVSSDSKPVASAIVMHSEKWIGFPWAGSLEWAHALRPNNLLYWKIIEYACLNGYRSLDLGRSPAGSGSLHFKCQWGGVAEPLWYYRKTIGNRVVEVRDASDPTMRAASRLWRMLPRKLSTRLGPHLARLIP